MTTDAQKRLAEIQARKDFLAKVMDNPILTQRERATAAREFLGLDNEEKQLQAGKGAHWLNHTTTRDRFVYDAVKNELRNLKGNIQ